MMSVFTSVVVFNFRTVSPSHELLLYVLVCHPREALAPTSEHTATVCASRLGGVRGPFYRAFKRSTSRSFLLVW